MEIDIDPGNNMILKKIFNAIVIETEEGNKFSLCLRDSGIEIGALRKENKTKWISIDPNGEIT